MRTFNGLGAALGALAMVVAAALGLTLLTAQGPVPNVTPPINIDMGQGTAAPGAAGTGTATCAVGAQGSCTLITLTGQAASGGAGTYNSAAQVNFDKIGLMCTIGQVTSTGGPTTTIAVQAFDSIANAYQTIGISGSITTPVGSLMVYPGAVNGSPPTGLTISGVAVPRVWRVQQVVSGGTGLASKINCNVLKAG